MNELLNWIGKEDSITLSYDVIGQTPLMLPCKTNNSEIPSDKKEIGRNLADIEWDHSINKADKIDYELSICCGIVCGLLDSFFVGDFSLEKANTWGSDKINKFVIKISELDGFKCSNTNSEEEILQKAITHLEKNHGMSADSVTNDFGGGRQHHFRDFSHHFSIVGLLCSIYTQFSKLSIGTDTDGKLLIVHITDESFIGTNVHEKILFGTVEWVFHMASDMAGSNLTPGNGTGIPGPLLSFLKELSTLPFFRDATDKEIGFRKWLSKLFNGTLLAKHDSDNKIIKDTVLRFDLRTEIGLVNQIGLQLMPVALNECLVRGLYFIRRTYIELKDLKIHSIKELNKINPVDILPTNNRVVLRMLTIASGTFTVIDIADAGARALIQHKGKIKDPLFWIDFIVRINFPGIGRFVIACGMDGKLVLEESQQEKIRKDSFSSQCEKELSQLSYFTYSLEETRIYFSLLNQSLQYDINSTEKEKAKICKTEWLHKWKSSYLSNLPIIESEKNAFFYSEIDLYQKLDNMAAATRFRFMQFLVLDFLAFKPYYNIGSEHDKKYEHLKLDSNYLKDVFCTHQNIINSDAIERYRKVNKKYHNILTGDSKHKVIGALGTVVLISAAGGIAFVAAPAIAPAIAAAFFGESFAGLSGAALTSASLATLGGGSLAAGGFGMAGGTAMISGGGALLGMLGGTGLSAATSMTVLPNEGAVLDECTKLLVYCKVILSDIYHLKNDLLTINTEIVTKINEIEKQLNTLADNNELDKKQRKELISIYKKNLKYLNRCEIELQKIIENEEGTQE